MANNCYGYSLSGTAMGCYGQSTSGVGIFPRIANSCTVRGGTTNITYKNNIPWASSDSRRASSKLNSL